MHIGARMQDLEDAMRKQLQKRRSLHATERALAMKAFKKAGAFLAKPQGGLAGFSRDISEEELTRVSTDAFSDAWSLLGVKVSADEARAMFNKYGQDRAGHLPCKLFLDALLAGRSRLLAKSARVHEGALSPDLATLPKGKIKYPQSRKGVFAPSNWEPAYVARSSKLPDAFLELDFIYGYSGIRNTCNNLFYNSEGRVVYYTAGVGVVYDRKRHRQRYFLGHDDDIRCIAVSPCRRFAATGQDGKHPTACVWDTREGAGCKELARLKHPAVRYLVACCFSPDGDYLATVGGDNHHTLHVWDWKQRPPRLVCERPTLNGTPPQVYGVVWDAHSPDIVTYGVNHVKFWAFNPTSGALTVNAGRFGKLRPHSITSAAVLPSGAVVTGNEDGQLCTWRDYKLVKVREAHGKGPKNVRPDGTISRGGIRCLRLRSDGRTLLRGGADGRVITWDVSGGGLGEATHKQLVKAANPNDTPPQFRGLDCKPGSGKFIAGTNRCDIWEVDADPEILIFGHAADLYGVCCHPKVPHVFMTACESDKIAIWDIKSRKMLRQLSMGTKARCVDFAPDGTHIAVGMVNGAIQVLDYKNLDAVFWNKDFGSAVSDVKFSPNGRYLAAASHDTFVDVFDRHRDYRKVCRCAGHSSTVRHLDWSADNKIIQTNSSDYEVLYWDVKTGKQVRQNQRDTNWHTWTCILGFPVMGIWKEGFDGTDVNSTDRSKSREYIATADDVGKINLYNYPCVVEKAPAKEYKGHSSHIMNVRFNADDKYLISVGGKDRAVFQWKTRGVAAGDVVEKVSPRGLRAKLEVPWAKDDIVDQPVLDNIR